MTQFNHDVITPYKNDEAKKNQVRQMFDGIAPKYDFLNHFLSLGTDILWRKIALSKIKKYSNSKILDVATGTGDLAIAAAKKFNAKQITGVDIADKMLEIGRIKVQKENLQNIIQFETGDSENLQFNEGSFDTVMSSFGVRNFENLEKGLSEMYRVLKPDGIIMVLEFSRPRIFPVKQLYNFYFQNILPLIGKMVSKDSKAYSYLYESSSKFPCFEEFVMILNTIGFKNTRYYPISFGICTIYIGQK